MCVQISVARLGSFPDRREEVGGGVSCCLGVCVGVGGSWLFTQKVVLTTLKKKYVGRACSFSFYQN